MALFSKEPETTAKAKEPVKPAAPAQPVASVAAAPEKRPYAAVTGTSPGLTQPGMPTPAEGTYLDKGSSVSGKLVCEGPLRIHGQVEGEISANEAVVITEDAVITAQLKAASVVIAGKISGDILASKRVEIRPTAKVFVNLATPILVVHEGALFEGNCSMHAEGSRADRKVTPIAKDERVVAPIAAEVKRA